MNLVEKSRCLFCGTAIRRGEEVAVMANVLVAHVNCLPGGSR